MKTQIETAILLNYDCFCENNVGNRLTIQTSAVKSTMNLADYRQVYA